MKLLRSFRSYLGYGALASLAIGCSTALPPAIQPGSLATQDETAPAPAPRDTTPHQVQFVTVAPGVKLEVLDWGGRGDPVVFLTGLGDNAHVYDGFAPAFTDRFHVMGITRRGFGAHTEGASHLQSGLGLEVLELRHAGNPLGWYPHPLPSFVRHKSSGQHRSNCFG